MSEIREDGDRGVPLVIADAAHSQSLAFVQIARQVLMRLEERDRRELGTIH